MIQYSKKWYSDVNSKIYGFENESFFCVSNNQLTERHITGIAVCLGRTYHKDWNLPPPITINSLISFLLCIVSLDRNHKHLSLSLSLSLLSSSCRVVLYDTAPEVSDNAYLTPLTS